MQTMTKQRIRKMLILSKFQIKSLWPQYLVLFGTLLIQFSVSMLVGRFAGESAGSLDFPMLAFATVLGVLLFSTAYRYAILNGLTRKMYLVTALLTSVLLSLAYALIAFALMSISHSTFPSNDLYVMVFGSVPIHFGSLLLFLWSSAMCMTMLGHFFTAVFYRTRMRGKLLVLGGTIVSAALLTGIHYLSGGALGRGLLNALIHLIGFGGDLPNPLIPCATFWGLSALLAAGSFLLLRKADLRS